MDKDKLWRLIDKEDDISDKEKREYYQSVIADKEAEERWQNEH